MPLAIEGNLFVAPVMCPRLLTLATFTLAVGSFGRYPSAIANCISPRSVLSQFFWACGFFSSSNLMTCRCSSVTTRLSPCSARNRSNMFSAHALSFGR